MACCIKHTFSNWCRDGSIVYIAFNGNEYCVSHVPAEHKNKILYDARTDKKPKNIEGQ